jgi:poly(hydroxyalkanoate) depolymerase family esterase
MYNPLEAMADATQLTRQGKLAEATRLIQRALRGFRTPAAAPAPADPPPSSPALLVEQLAPPEVEDIAFRELPTQAGVVAPQVEVIDLRQAPEVAEPTITPIPAAVPTPAQEPGTFDSHAFAFGSKRYSYRLFIPGAFAGAPPVARPVLVLLHGCKQDAADFAQGTEMNALAQQHQCIVVYPEQLRSANNMGCWNWFDPANQQRGSGEPELIAALARDTVARHGGDAERVYVAGLSAGGAMATLVAQLYPDVFAAVGVHSGLGPAVANDVVSAFAAMRKARRKPGARRAGAAPVLPTIVFHGTADKTVHPSNGDQIVQETLATFQAAGDALHAEEHQHSDAERAATRTLYAREDGVVMLEYWEVETGPHAWSGGDAAGSYTDPGGPSASEAMLEFFLRHRRAGPARSS